MGIGLLLFALGLAASGFCSGSETGLYRVSRTRLILDAMSGSSMARFLVWLLNRPSFLVATALIGNNLANYMTSSAVVMIAMALFPGTPTAEWLVPMLLTPLVFVLGELTPKSLFYRAPYRMLRIAQGPLMLMTVLLAPFSFVLGVLGQLLQFVTGQTPFQIELLMSRGELERVMRDGHEAGVLDEGQREIANQIFKIAHDRAIRFAVPVDRLAIVESPIDIDLARYRARRQNHPIILIQREGRIVGYVWYADINARHPNFEIRPILYDRTDAGHLKLLLEMYDRGAEVAILRDETGTARNAVTRRQLIQPLLSVRKSK